MTPSCADGGGASAAISAALHFYAAAQCLIAEPWPPHAQACNGSCYDFVVVGGGSAGSALAARLAGGGAGGGAGAGGGPSVLLLEAGDDPPKESIIPGLRDLLKGGRYDWNFETVNDSVTSQALVGGRQKQPRGRVLGGSGSTNDMVYARGFPADYHEWAAIAGDHWNWTNVLEYFKKSERLTDQNIINDEALMRYHGLEGPIEVAGFAESTYDTDRFIEAFNELGFPTVKDMTNPEKIGVGRFSHTTKDGRRASSLTAMLNPVGARPNLHVLRNATVAKVLVENGTAYGVQVFRNGEELHFYGRKEIVLTAGTFNTPKILMLSGIGPKEHLQQLKIDLVQDSPDVGENLQDHVMMLNFVAADNGTCFSDEAGFYMDIIKYLHDRSGPLSLSNSMGAYKSMNPSTPNVPDFAFYPTCMPIKSDFYDSCISKIGFNEDICSKISKLNQNYEIMTIAVVLLKPKSRGRVRLKSADPFDGPLIYAGTFSEPSDLEHFPDAVEIVRSLVNTTYFRRKNARYVELDIAGCEGTTGRKGAKCAARATAMTAWHALGTAAAGRALDARLRVRGLARLRVADLSAAPAAVRGNTNAPVVMIAEQAADFIKRDHGL